MDNENQLNNSLGNIGKENDYNTALPNQFVYHKKSETMFCPFWPDDLVVVLSALANFAASGKVEVQISDNKPGFHVYDTLAHKNADGLWQTWFDNLIDELNLDLNSSTSILSQIVTGLLALYTEDRSKYFKLATRPFRTTPLLRMSGTHAAPSDTDILIAALMRSEKENKNRNSSHSDSAYTIRIKLESSLKDISTDTLFYHEFETKRNSNSKLKDDLVAVNTLECFERIVDWVLYGELYYNTIDHSVHWLCFKEPLKAHKDSSNRTPWLIPEKRLYINDYPELRRELFKDDIEITFSHYLPSLSAEEYELLAEANTAAEEEHIYASAGWVLLDRNLIKQEEL